MEKREKLHCQNLDLIKEENSNLIQHIVFYVFNKQKYRFSHQPNLKSTLIVSTNYYQQFRSKNLSTETNHSSNLVNCYPESYVLFCHKYA